MRGPCRIRRYVIDSNLTGDMGRAFLATLTSDQAELVTSLVDAQKPFLYAIVDRRTDIATQLRRFMSEASVDSATVLNLAEQYGELDGEIVYRIATNFAELHDSLSAEQETQLAALRTQLLGDLAPTGAYLYSEPIAMPEIPNTDFLFDGAAVEPSAYTMAALPDTGQTGDYTATFGEDSDYTRNPPSYTDNGDGTVTDNVTGLMWQQADGGEMTWENAVAYADSLTLGGHAVVLLVLIHDVGVMFHSGSAAYVRIVASGGSAWKPNSLTKRGIGCGTR